MSNDIPVAWVENTGFIDEGVAVIVRCPFCMDTHRHDGADPRAFDYGTKSAPCKPQSWYLVRRARPATSQVRALGVECDPTATTDPDKFQRWVGHWVGGLGVITVTQSREYLELWRVHVKIKADGYERDLVGVTLEATGATLDEATACAQKQFDAFVGFASLALIARF